MELTAKSEWEQARFEDVWRLEIGPYVARADFKGDFAAWEVARISGGCTREIAYGTAASAAEAMTAAEAAIISNNDT